MQTSEEHVTRFELPKTDRWNAIEDYTREFLVYSQLNNYARPSAAVAIQQLESRCPSDANNLVLRA